jgi:hypothetical protein
MTRIDTPQVTGFHAGWSTEGTTRRDELAKAWTDAGLDEDLLPPRSTSPAAALTKTAEGMRSRKLRRFPRPLPGEGKGYVLVDEETKGDDLDWNEMLRMELMHDVEPVVALVTPHDHPLAKEIRSSFREHLETLTSADMTTWLCKLVEILGGTHMLRRGSWYFMPNASEAIWMKAVAVIKQVANVSFTFSRAFSADPEGVDCILEAIVAEADAMIAGTKAEMYPEDEEKQLGSRALKTRTKKCKAMVDKVQKYETLLGRRLPEVQDRLGELEADLVEVALSVETTGGPNQTAFHPALAV